MSSLTVFDFESNNIRFEKRGERVWVCLTDMAKASGKLLGDWNRLKATAEFLTEFAESMGFPIDQIIYSNESSGSNETRGTWAVEEVALEFAGWCSVQFKIWMLQQIKTLMTEGIVSLKPMSPAEIIIAQGQLLLALEQKQAALETKIEMQQMQIEANQMETEANTLELERFRHGHGHYFSVAAYCALKGIKKDLNWMTLQGKKATALCRGQKISPVPVTDPRWGKVNTYPDSVLEELNW